ncbi:EMSY protein, partial [Balaeniceps rex]|nr:EMSY protein [Balaeniceps rex]
TLTSLQGEKTIQAVPAGAKPAIITATRPITKMIVTQPKGIGSAVQPATKIIPTKIVYGQQGKTQVHLIQGKFNIQRNLLNFDCSNQSFYKQLRYRIFSLLETVHNISSVLHQESIIIKAEVLQNDSMHPWQYSQPVVHVIASRSQDWSEHEIAVDTSPTIIYQDVSSESQSATSTIKALLELQQTTAVKEKLESKPRQPTIDLSQMAVPIQMTQEKRHSPESPSIAVVESELVAEYITT